jgi:hypothetical protein
MNSDDFDDPVAAALGALRERDVSAARAYALRKRCHGALRRTRRRRTQIESDIPQRRRLAPAVLVIVSALYLIETLRLAAGIGILW